ncbi:uncharacterized protein BJ212DRAFT_1409258 [Suillus subaureus]|uniref:Uncharacterized protein n=1 Tax=Suillus subaureus TaxID=48587 RepID=A0A9P7DJB2_9AGAM|nr:uncharacterized protein BJ212DRAFT_1409258 [Suillus subaureus]KAG1796126.1 hypothetical protein BJ212DRAFT_1409258 [Suillus subaureus]
MPPVIEREKVICFVEIKPKSLRAKDPFPTAEVQLSRQAYYAFMADSTLTTIGAILAFGSIWRYVEFPRPPMHLASSWSESKDPTFGRQSPSQSLLPRVPSYLSQLSGNKHASFDLSDSRGLSEIAVFFDVKIVFFSMDIEQFLLKIGLFGRPHDF